LNNNKIKSAFSIIILNYKRIIKNILVFFLYILLVVSSSVIITLPIWYVATHYSRLYTVIIILGVIILVSLGFYKKIKGWIILKQEKNNSFKDLLKFFSKKTGIFFLFLTGLYAIIFLFSKGQVITGVLLTFILFLLLGYFIFVRKINNEIN
jgi:hypothetical protein